MFITHSECCEDAGSDALGLGMDLTAFVSHKSPGDDMLISHSCFNRKVLITCSEKAMAPHSSTLAWKIPWTEEPGGLQSMGSQRVGHD